MCHQVKLWAPTLELDNHKMAPYKINLTLLPPCLNGKSIDSNILHVFQQYLQYENCGKTGCHPV